MTGLVLLAVLVMPPACAGGGFTSSAARRHFALRPWSYEPRLVREHDELRAVARVQLDHRPADVRACRGRADEELGRDLLVRETLRDERDDLAFPLGESLHLRRRQLGPGRATRELPDEPSGDARREQRFAGGDL